MDNSKFIIKSIFGVYELTFSMEEDKIPQD